MDKYVIDQYLAEGGMGAIYVGKKLGAGGFEKQVVLKQLLPEFTKQPEFIDLFLREARLSATLDHANITHTIDLVSTGKDHFIVMEFVNGDDLRSLFKKAKKRKKRISVAAGIFIAQETLSALAYAHQKRGPDDKPLKLIHRDISPSNILVSKNGEVKLTDFGIAKAATHNSIFYRVKGKVGYMSPEQAKSEALDPRSDLYSLAVCFYEMITGERLFVSQGITTSAEDLYNQPIPVVSQKIESAPKTLDAIFLKALALNPNDRYQNAALFQEALLKCAHKHGLFMSSRTLATHLADVCYGEGEPVDETGFDPHTGAFPGDDGTEQLDLNEISGVSSIDDFIMVGETIIRESDQKLAPERNGLTQLNNFQGKELTSIIAPDISHLLEEDGNEPLDVFEEFESLSEINDQKMKSDYDDELRTVARLDSSDFNEEIKTVALHNNQLLEKQKNMYPPRTVEKIKPVRIKTAKPRLLEQAPNEDSSFREDNTPLPVRVSEPLGSVDSWMQPKAPPPASPKMPKGKSSEESLKLGLSPTLAVPQLASPQSHKNKSKKPTPPKLSTPAPPKKDEPIGFQDHTFGDFFEGSESGVSIQTPTPNKLQQSPMKNPKSTESDVTEFNHLLAVACLIVLTLATVAIIGLSGPRLDF